MREWIVFVLGVIEFACVLNSHVYIGGLFEDSQPVDFFENMVRGPRC